MTKVSYQLSNTVFSDICTEEKNSRGGIVEFAFVLETLVTRSEKIDGLPPGGGVYAK